MGNQNIKTKTELKENHIECSFCGVIVDKETITRDLVLKNICQLCLYKMKCFQMF